MKKSILFVFALLSSVSLFAQDVDSDADYKADANEIKLNALYGVLGALDLTYERLLNEESGAGIEVFIPLDDDINDDINYYVSPYYRLYFGDKYAAGFFLEGFGLLSSENETYFDFSNEFDPSPTIRRDKVTNFALGIGVGGKWITNSGFVGELGFGVGRNIINNYEDGGDFVGKLQITVGYRF